MKAVLIDDEKYALEYLDYQLKKLSNIKIVGKYNHIELKDLVDLAKEIDLIFLDIKMPQLNGLELAEQLIETNPHLFVVFVSAYDEHAVEAFELNALDFLLKPINPDRLRKTIDRIKSIKKEKPISRSSRLQINVCWEFSYLKENGKKERVTWRTTKARELFLYLLHHRDQTVQKGRLVELLWEDLDEDKAFAQLYTTIYHIRKTIQKFKDYISIQNVHDGYVLKTDQIELDIERWESTIISAPPLSIQTVYDYEKHMILYTAPYLGAYDYLWAENERYRYEELWIKTAYQIAECFEQNGLFDQAEKWYKKICTMRPEEESAHYGLMKLYGLMGYGMLVSHQFQSLKKEMEDLNLKVNPEITQWYEQWVTESTRKN